jgi:bifunctional enzyme CysN/CysC
MICRPHNHSAPVRELEAMVCWMSERPLRAGATYALKHTTRQVRARVEELRYRIDVNTLHRDETSTELGLNAIGRIALRTSGPLMIDPYARSRATGSLILVDEDTNETVGAAMALELAG